MRYRLRTLLFVLAIGPPALAVGIAILRTILSNPGVLKGPLVSASDGPYLDRVASWSIAGVLVAGMSMPIYRRNLLALVLATTSVVLWVSFGAWFSYFASV